MVLCKSARSLLLLLLLQRCSLKFHFPIHSLEILTSYYLSDPPAVFSPDKQLYITTCNATTPEMGITISGKTFHINRADMFLPAHQDSLCATTITVGFPVPKKIYPDGFYAFGDAFLKNVVAVFDVGAGEMQFAPHSNY